MSPVWHLSNPADRRGRGLLARGTSGGGGTGGDLMRGAGGSGAAAQDLRCGWGVGAPAGLFTMGCRGVCSWPQKVLLRGTGGSGSMPQDLLWGPRGPAGRVKIRCGGGESGERHRKIRCGAGESARGGRKICCGGPERAGRRGKIGAKESLSTTPVIYDAARTPGFGTIRVRHAAPCQQKETQPPHHGAGAVEQ